MVGGRWGGDRGGRVFHQAQEQQEDLKQAVAAGGGRGGGVLDIHAWP